MTSLAIYNIKGGVGKTTTAVNLAYLAAAEGRRTLLWDLDPQAAATYVFRVRARVKGGGRRIVQGNRSLDSAIKGTDFDRLDLLPADFTYRHMDLMLDRTKRPVDRLRRILRPLRADYDVIVLDCPPSVSLVSENVLRAVDTVLSPLIPTTLAVRTFDQLTEFVDTLDRQPRLLGFFSMVDRRKKLHRDLVEQLPKERTDIARTAIPAQSLIEQMPVHRMPVPHFAPRSLASRCYRELFAEVLDGADASRSTPR